MQQNEMCYSRLINIGCQRGRKSQFISDTPKIQLHVEQLYLKVTWTPVEWIFYSYGIKKRLHQDKKKEKDGNLIRTCTTNVGTHKQEEYHGSKGP